MDELDKEFIDEICNMRMEIAFRRMLESRTHTEAEQVMARGEAIYTLYKKVVKECTEEGKKYLAKYADEVAYRESDDAEFNYKTGFTDGVQLILMLRKLTTNLQ